MNPIEAKLRDLVAGPLGPSLKAKLVMTGNPVCVGAAMAIEDPELAEQGLSLLDSASRLFAYALLENMRIYVLPIPVAS